MNLYNKQHIKLTFLGDIMCLPDMIEKAKTNSGYDFTEMFSELKSFLADSDYCFANLETPIAIDNQDLSHAEASFNSPYEFAKAVYGAGIDFVSTANNHCLDRGMKGVADTIASLDKIGLAHTGTFWKKKKSTILDVQGVRLGVLAYTYGTNAFANQHYLTCKNWWKVNLFQNQELSFWFDRYAIAHPQTFISRVYRYLLRHVFTANKNKDVYERIERHLFRRLVLLCDVIKLKWQNPDYIVLLAHMGGQYNEETSIETTKLCGFLRRIGVNLIIGSHEHVVHGVDFSKRMNRKYALYCLGNCATSYGVSVPPFNVGAEFSIAWHVYINSTSKQIEKCTYSLLQNVQLPKSKMIQVVPVNRLYKLTKDEGKKQKMKAFVGNLTYKFAKKKEDTILAEYLM